MREELFYGKHTFNTNGSRSVAKQWLIVSKLSQSRLFIHYITACATPSEQYHFSPDPTRKNTEGCKATTRTATYRIWCAVAPGPTTGVEDFESHVRAQLGSGEPMLPGQPPPQHVYQQPYYGQPQYPQQSHYQHGYYYPPWWSTAYSRRWSSGLYSVTLLSFLLLR